MESEGKENLLKEELLRILTAFPLGLSEYDLISELRSSTSLIPDRFGADNLLLFRTHFILFNGLYRLKEELEEGGELTLEITPLSIRLRNIERYEGKDAIVERRGKKLSDYYLDMENLEGTTKQDVDKMLDSFWTRYLARDDRKEALDLLDLADPVDHKTIRKRYRSLAREFHPDRGGDKVRLQEINAAMDLLEKGFNR